MARLEHPGVIQVLTLGEPNRVTICGDGVRVCLALNPYMRGPWTWPQLWNVIHGLLTALVTHMLEKLCIEI